MRRIAITNQKGGVGKTTTCVNLGAAAAALGKRVLLVDLDPQSHLTTHLGVDGNELPGTYDLLTSDIAVEDTLVKLNDRLAVIPARLDLAGSETELISVVGREMILRDKLAKLKDDFDYLLIDCPPSFSVLTLNAMVAVNEVIVPLQAHFLGLQGVGKLLETVRLVADRLNTNLRVAGFALCMFETGTRLAAEVVADLEQFITDARDQNLPWSAARVFDARIRRNIKLAESPSYGQSIFDYAASSNGAEDYAALASEVFGIPNILAAQKSDDVVLQDEDDDTAAAGSKSASREVAKSGNESAAQSPKTANKSVARPVSKSDVKSEGKPSHKRDSGNGGRSAVAQKATASAPVKTVKIPKLPPPVVAKAEKLRASVEEAKVKRIPPVAVSTDKADASKDEPVIVDASGMSDTAKSERSDSSQAESVNQAQKAIHESSAAEREAPATSVKITAEPKQTESRNDDAAADTITDESSTAATPTSVASTATAVTPTGSVAPVPVTSAASVVTPVMPAAHGGAQSPASSAMATPNVAAAARPPRSVVVMTAGGIVITSRSDDTASR